MIRNIRLKRFLTDAVFPVFSFLNRFIPKDDRVLFFYCANDELKDNSGAVFDYLVEHGYNKRYKIICGLGNPGRYREKITENVRFIPKIQCVWQFLRSGHVFYSTGKIPIQPTEHQTVVQMWHGIPLKTIGLLSKHSSGKEFFFTYICSSSETWRPIMAAAFGCPLDHVRICGEPKADKLFFPKQPQDTKLIVWAPTFRQSALLGYSDSSMASLLPLFPKDDWAELNAFLREKRVRIIVKLHAGQDLGGFTSEKLSHLEVYSSATYVEELGDIYELLAQSDALITDYSSIFFNYLVLNRPICYVLDDFDEYRATRGFVVEDPLSVMPGKKVYTREDLFSFISDVASGTDTYAQERERVNRMVNAFPDGNNCKRILNIAGIV